MKMTITLGRAAEGVLQKETEAERKRIRSDFILFTQTFVDWGRGGFAASPC